MWKCVVPVFLHAFFLSALTSQDKATLIKIGKVKHKKTPLFLLDIHVIRKRKVVAIRKYSTAPASLLKQRNQAMCLLFDIFSEVLKESFC